MCKKLNLYMKEMLKLTSGCTEPAAVALNAAYAGQKLESAVPDVFRIEIDELTYKNAFNAGIPNGKDKRGTKWAAVLGYAAADPSGGLEIFNLVDEDVNLKAEKICRDLTCDIKVVKKMICIFLLR